MKVNIVESTDNPEQLVCKAARGDYYDGYIYDTSYYDLMKPVDTDREDRVCAMKKLGNADKIDDDEDIPIEDISEEMQTEARTRSFLRSQLSRGHYGPWEHPSITFSVKEVSRVTMAQITRHRHMTFDVQSQRYVDFSEVDSIVPASILSRDTRINRYPEVYEENEDHFSRESGIHNMDEDEIEKWNQIYKKKTSEALDDYERMVENGIPKEDARYILPLGTPVNMTFSGNARTFMHLLDMRKKSNAQWEIRELSERLINYLKTWMPYTYNHYERMAPNKLSP